MQRSALLIQGTLAGHSLTHVPGSNAPLFKMYEGRHCIALAFSTHLNHAPPCSHAWQDPWNYLSIQMNRTSPEGDPDLFGIFTGGARGCAAMPCNALPCCGLAWQDCHLAPCLEPPSAFSWPRHALPSRFCTLPPSQPACPHTSCPHPCYTP